MDIINGKALSSVSYDKTITCTIKDDKNAKKGEYTVYDGSRLFEAYSNDTSYKVGTTVFVTIPEGKFENQKMIIGKKTSNEEKPFVFTEPFGTIFDMTGNIAAEASAGALTANDILDEHKQANVNLKDCFTSQYLLGTSDSFYNLTEKELIKYTRLGIKADFTSWVKQAVKGTYGLIITLKGKKKNIIESEKDEEIIKEYVFDNSQMFGNTYNFETPYEQQVVVDLEQADMGQIIGIKVEFAQSADFYDQLNEPIPSTENGYLNYQPVANYYQRYGDDTENDNNGNLTRIKEGNGYYRTANNDSKLLPNLLVNNLYICFGYDISIFDNDFVEIYTAESDTYKRSTSTSNDGIEANQKELKMRWVHIVDGKPIDMVNTEQEHSYEVRWYKYSVGVAAADQYCGVYWERISEASGFNYVFNPDVNKQQEKIKAIVFGDSLTPYRSNELIFNNEEQLPPSEEAQHIMNALMIECDDNTNGNYMVYGQDNSIKDTAFSKEIRTLTAYFDANNDGQINKETEKIQEFDNLIWTFPTNNTMIELLNGKSYDEIQLQSYVKEKYYIKNENDEYEVATSETVDLNVQYYQKTEGSQFEKINNLYKPSTYYIKDYLNCKDLEFDSIENVYYQLIENEYKQVNNLNFDTYEQNRDNYYIYTYILHTGEYNESLQYYRYNASDSGTVVNIQPRYKISSYYSPSKSNNTITCQYTLNGVVYTTEKEFTFGPAGTMGSDQTLVIDFVGDKNSVIAGEEVVSFQVQLYDNQNKLQVIPDDSVKWAWYYNNDLKDEITCTNAIWHSQYKFKLDKLYIIQATVGNLTTYFPIPVSNGQYSYIKGATQVIYQSNGEPSYNREEYQLFGKDDKVVNNINWKVISFEEDPYIATLSNTNENKGFLKPVQVYVKEASVYGVQAYVDENILWTQPILVLQNRWASNTINQWDGKSIQIDNKDGTILSQAIAAGHKNSDNSFSGVMIGSWKDTDTAPDITAQTGIYGFHKGAMSYAWKDDGTGFIGKDGLGRINFDGNKATIYSTDYKINSDGSVAADRTTGSMIIDLNEPYIQMKYGNNIISIDASKTGTVNSASSSNAPFKIGSKFAVAWDGTIYASGGNFSGHIDANSGTIGAWEIDDSGRLKSNDNNIILDPANQGTITLAGANSMISGGTIHGSIIRAGTLQSNSTNNIKLQGYLTIDTTNNSDDGGTGALMGRIDSGFGLNNSAGIGFRYAPGNDGIRGGEIKATASNVGMRYGASGGSGYIFITSTTPSFSNHLNKNTITIGGTEGNENYLVIQNIPAANQTGIYARFA